MKVATLFTNKGREASLRKQLAEAEVTCHPIASISAALHALRSPEVDALLLEDAGAELADWLSMLQRRAAANVPVLVVGAPHGLGIAEALLHGAADYIDAESPVNHWLARLRAHVGTQRTQRRQELEVGPYELCASTSTVSVDGIEVSLTAREFALAWALFSKAGRTVTQASLAACVWGRSSDVCKRTLEQHIYKLRRKLSVGGSAAFRIQAVYSVGYRLDVVAAPCEWRPSYASRLLDDGAAAPLVGPTLDELLTRA